MVKQTISPILHQNIRTIKHNMKNVQKKNIVLPVVGQNRTQKERITNEKEKEKKKEDNKEKVTNKQ